MDKFVAQCGLLDVEDGLWVAHATKSLSYISVWAAAVGAPPWMSLLMFIDGSAEPYWTHRYAKSSKISRTGQVGPCLTRVAVNSGAGIPFLMETVPGSLPLKKELPRILDRVDAIVGEGAVGKIVVVDAEMSSAVLLQIFLEPDSKRDIITVVKGRKLSENFTASTPWQAFRTDDMIREGIMVIHGKGAPKEGLKFRCVEMRRPGRHPHSTFFVTTCKAEAMSTEDVVRAYLFRWPLQEHTFRNTGDGLGMHHTHGFGGEWVEHGVLVTKKNAAQSHLSRAQEKEQQAKQDLMALTRLKQKAARGQKTSFDNLIKAAQVHVAKTKRTVVAGQKEVQRLATTSPQIWERDTARENVVTAMSMNMFFLIEFVLREYFGGLRIQLRTFIEHFVNLPVTVITTKQSVTYRIAANERNPKRAEQMRNACAEITRRGLRRDHRLLVFEVEGPKRKPLKVP